MKTEACTYPYRQRLYRISEKYAENLSTRSKRKIARQLDLETIRRTLQTSASALVVDDKEIAVGSVDVT